MHVRYVLSFTTNESTATSKHVIVNNMIPSHACPRCLVTYNEQERRQQQRVVNNVVPSRACLRYLVVYNQNEHQRQPIM